jgi:hypothetical protein
MTERLARNRVLWVDDHPENNREARPKLEEKGIEVPPVEPLRRP